ncbi:hypothetical protein V1264_008394 [Littorina saxatilis]
MVACVAMVLSQLLVGVVHGIPFNNGNGNSVGKGLGQGPSHLPQFDSVEELCEWLCNRQSPHFNYGCPPSCDGGILDSWSKRAARGRRYDDFSFGFDDYLFMKLLGRNLGDQA